MGYGLWVMSIGYGCMCVPVSGQRVIGFEREESKEFKTKNIEHRTTIQR